MAVMAAVNAVLLNKMLCIQGLDVILLLQCRGNTAVMPSVTAVLLQHTAMDAGTEFNVLVQVRGENSGYACSYCSTVTSHCYG